MTTDQWLELLKYLGFAVGLYSAIRVDMTVLKIKVEHHEKEFARINRLLEK